jgi:hypothetical protein
MDQLIRVGDWTLVLCGIKKHSDHEVKGLPV